MDLTDACVLLPAIAERARSVAIDSERRAHRRRPALARARPRAHYLEGSPRISRPLADPRRDQLRLGLVPDAPQAAGRSGYFTVAGRSRSASAPRPWSARSSRDRGREVAAMLGQDPGHELMRLYAGRCETPAASSATAGAGPGRGGGRLGERLAGSLARGMPLSTTAAFFKRAQLVADDLASPAWPASHDLDRLTIFADNLVPHVLRVDGVLRYDPELARTSTPASRFRQGARGARAPRLRRARLRAARRPHGCAAPRSTCSLWNRGQRRPTRRLARHRTRTVLLLSRARLHGRVRVVGEHAVHPQREELRVLGRTR